MAESKKRLFIKITRENLPQVSTKYPFNYLERGRLEIDDSSIKWIDSDCNVVRLPIATINTLLLGPGTSITHEAVKVCATANCAISWVGEDSLLFYAVGQSPTSNTRNLKKQIAIASDKKKSLAVGRRMFSSSIYALGYSPHVGFIHSGSPLPFVYDIADLYKEHLCIDLAFALTLEMAGVYSKEKMSATFRSRFCDMHLLEKIPEDISCMLYGENDDRRDSK